MGAQAISGIVGLVGGKIGSTVSTAMSAEAEIKASKMRRDEAKKEYGAEATKIRHEGDVFLAEQRAVIGRSGVERSGSALDLLAANAEAIERDAATTWQEGLNVARMESLRRKAIRSGRDLALASTWLIPGGSAQGATTVGGLVSGERNTSEATLARRLQTGRFGAGGRVLSGGYGSYDANAAKYPGAYGWGKR